MQNTNGHTESKPFAKLSDIAPVPLVGKQPQTWGTALEICRVAKGWTHKQLIAEALRGENVSIADVKRWEQCRSDPTLNQAHKLRAAIAPLGAYDHLLKMHLRAVTKNAPKAPEIPVQPEGWPGPAVKNFGEALRWMRTSRGMNQGDICRTIGISNSVVSKWETDSSQRLIPEVYRKLCDLFPGLGYAPKPALSAKYVNQFKKTAFLASKEMERDTARAVRTVEASIAAQATGMQTFRIPVIDRAPLTAASAEYGVAAGNVQALKVELQQAARRHAKELAELQEKLLSAENEMLVAQEKMEKVSHEMHGGTP